VKIGGTGLNTGIVMEWGPMGGSTGQI